MNLLQMRRCPWSIIITARSISSRPWLSVTRIVRHLSVGLLLVFGLTSVCPAQNPLDKYNIVWTSPSHNAAGSMPLGNGEVGLNLWVEENGDLLFYISRTDSWSECCRLLKLGRIRVSLSPNPFTAGTKFRQELKLHDGRVEIAAGPVTLQVFVDADRPVIYVTGRSDSPVEVKATLENWRTEKRVLKDKELESCWTMRKAPDSIEVSESADIIPAEPANAVVWYHRNETSVVPFTWEHQGLMPIADKGFDPLLHRTFGGWMTATGFVKDGKAGLRADKAVKEFTIKIGTESAQTETVDQWLEAVEKIAASALGGDDAAATTARWWNEFWNRSWIFVEGDEFSARVTEAYILQRWITACGGRGNYPIKFNGTIFTVDPVFTMKQFDFNADWRRWGDCYWWQNTRFPYFPMVARGDYDQLKPLFRMYESVTPLCKARAKLYYDADGVYFPETMTIFGTYGNNDYGWKRQGRQPNEVLAPWWQYAWQQGLELVALMLDYYDHTEDPKFLTEELVPMAHDVLSYYDTRFKRDAAGKLVISPTQCCETYRIGVTNDTCSVAGLIDVTDRLLALPADRVPKAERAFWAKMKAATPPLPVRDGQVMPAAAFNPKRNNAENVTFYAIWPFRLLGVGRPDLKIAAETFRNRVVKASFGWQYDGQCAALAGLADEAKGILVGKLEKANPNFRFPAMWGPNYDWLPDQDHGNNIMLTLQNMVLQTVGDKIYVLPAWPKDWNVSFKLHAPRNTTVEVVYRAGKLEQLKVSPESRRKDVVSPQ